MSVGATKLRDRIALRMKTALAEGTVSAETKTAFEEWLKGKDNAEAPKIASAKVIEACKKDKSDVAKEIISLETISC